jgi:hypothetical protein
LELLATVDFAALEILKSKKAVTMANVKHVIATSKKWTAKLNRELFIARIENSVPNNLHMKNYKLKHWSIS